MKVCAATRSIDAGSAIGNISVFYLKEELTWNHAIGFALIAAGAAFVFRG